MLWSGYTLEAADLPKIPPLGDWQMGAGVAGAKDISGARCAPPRKGAPVCLMVSDEGRSGTVFRMGDRTIVPLKEFKFLDDKIAPGTGKKLDEADLEAIDYDRGYFYATGSHALPRKSDQEQASRFFVYRIPVDASSDSLTAAAEVSAKLRQIMQKEPALGQFVGKRASKGEINIEGLAARDGRLFFGFREPVIDGTAYVLQVSEAALFVNSDAKKGTGKSATLGPAHAKLHKLKLGPGIGIRDMAKLQDGFLILAGPAKDEDGPYSLHYWAGPGTGAQALGELVLSAKARDGKAEGLMILRESGLAYELLVLFDGAEGGAPTEYHLTRKAAP